MSNATSIRDFVRDESFTINKRTNRGKHALRLVEQASAEYTVAIGKTSEWDDEGAVHFVLNDAEGTKSAITDRDFTIATIVAPSGLRSEEGDNSKTESGE